MLEMPLFMPVTRSVSSSISLRTNSKSVNIRPLQCKNSAYSAHTHKKTSFPADTETPCPSNLAKHDPPANTLITGKIIHSVTQLNPTHMEQAAKTTRRYTDKQKNMPSLQRLPL
jgi:hypothetical protein